MASRAELNPSPEAWSGYEDCIRVMVQERCSMLMGQAADHGSCEDILRKIQERFQSIDRSNPFWLPAAVSTEVDAFIEERRLTIWTAHKAAVIEALEIAIPPVARGLDESYAKFLLGKVNRHFGDKFQECMAAENVRDWVKNLTAKIVEAEILAAEDDRLLSDETRQFLQERRKELQCAQMDVICQRVKKALPAAAQEFEEYYVHVLPKQILACSRDHKCIPPGSPTWDKLVADSVSKLTSHGQLRDEELVRLYRAGYEKGRTMLLERYAKELHDLVPRVIFGRNLCPSMEDPTQFARDVAQDVSVNLLQKLDSYKLEGTFEAWLGTIIANEANTRTGKLIGKVKGKRRTYVSFEDLERELAAPNFLIIEDRERRKILHKALQKHREGGVKDENSTVAIELRYFEELKTAEIAERMGKKKSYVDQLFSDDYPKIRQILIDDFGLTGTEL